MQLSANLIDWVLEKNYIISSISVHANFNFLPKQLNFCCGSYSKEETIQGQKLYEEIRTDRNRQFRQFLVVSNKFSGFPRTELLTLNTYLKAFTYLK